MVYIYLPDVLGPPEEHLVVLEEGEADHQVAPSLLQVNTIHVHHTDLRRGRSGSDKCRSTVLYGEGDEAVLKVVHILPSIQI